MQILYKNCDKVLATTVRACCGGVVALVITKDKAADLLNHNLQEGLWSRRDHHGLIALESVMRVGNLNFKQIKLPISGLLYSLPASWCPYIIVCTYLISISKLSAPIILSHGLDVVEWHLSISSVHFALWSEFRLMIRKREMLCVIPGRTYRFLIFGFSPHAHTNIGRGEDI